MKRITLFALCMLVLCSGSAVAGTWTPWTGFFTISEGTTDFNHIALLNISGGSVFGVQALPTDPNDYRYGFQYEGRGWDGSWKSTIANPTTASGDLENMLMFDVNFIGDPALPLQFYVDVYNGETHLDHVEFEYVPNVPEPSLMLLLGIGLGAVVLMMWRRGV